MAADHRKRNVAALFVLVALIGVIGVLLLGSLGGAPHEGPEAPGHPAIAAGQACTSCKDAPNHTYKHEQPFTSQSCEECHTLTSWRVVRYTHTDHDFNQSLHAVIGCARCHEEGTPAPSPACQDCHALKSPHDVEKPQCGMCHTVTAWPLLKGVPKGHLSLEGGHAGLSCFKCHSEVRAPALPDRRCVDCHGTNHGGLTACQDCHEPARGWDPVPGFDHSAFFPLTGPHASLECAQCHKNDRFAGTPGTCAGCHGSVPHPSALGAGCKSCHSADLVSAHSGSASCQSCHMTSNARVRGAVARGDSACTTCHPTTWDHKPLHTSRLAADCAACHKPNLVDEHARLSCAACHSSTKAAVRSAIAAGNLACTACHGANAGQHTAQHQSTLAADCAACHNANLITEHAGRKCATCHASADPAVRGAIAAGDLRCATCHPATWDHNALHESALIETCTGCHDRNLVTGHRALGCAACHQSAEPRVVAAIANGDLSCFACHGNAANDVVIHRFFHDSSPGALCLDCHTVNLLDDHDADPRVCSTCHESTDPNVTGAIADRDKNCARCHPTTQGHTPLHASSLEAMCTACHSVNLVTEHDALGCAACHKSTNPAVTGAISAGNLACDACHDLATGTHRAAHTPDVSACAGCHNAAATNVVDLHPGCAACHGAGVTPSFTCANCHPGQAAPDGGVIPHGHDIPAPYRTNCTASGCHPGTDAAAIHAATTSGCGACHASGVTPSLRCFDCHPGQAASDGSVIFHGYDAAMHTATDATGEITMFTTTHWGAPLPVTWTESCSTCHALTLREVHGGQNSCVLCHGGTTPPRASFAAWDGTCSQGACHDGHTDTVTPHAPLDDRADQCTACHVGATPAEVSCTSSGCHP